jgi:hypothetical protein
MRYPTLLLAALASLAPLACVHEPGSPPVSQTNTTSSKVPVTDTSPYGPADYGFGHSLGPDGNPDPGNVDPGSPYNTRQNPGNIYKDSKGQ